jgi:hypothetical protein
MRRGGQRLARPAGLRSAGGGEARSAGIEPRPVPAIGGGAAR